MTFRMNIVLKQNVEKEEDLLSQFASSSLAPNIWIESQTKCFNGSIEIRAVINNIESLGCRHSSMDSSELSILSAQVRLPSTPSTFL